MTTAWYYDYYEQGTFPNQKALCEAVRWTHCSFDCQSLVSPTHLTGVATNPLTLRLRTLQNVLNQLEKEIGHINANIKKTANNQFMQGQPFAIAMKLHTQDSQLETGGAAIEEISLPENQLITLRYDTVHFALYDFFTNVGSILDRLAYEINLLYELGDWVEDRLDWSKLTNPRKTFLDSLNIKDQNLSKFIKEQTSNFKKVLYYRNRLIHDSIIRTNIEPVGFPRKFHVFLPPAPNEKKQRDVNAVTFCKRTRTKVLKSLDGSYKLMLHHLENHGKPPW